MKKTIALLVSTIIIIFFVGCEKQKNNQESMLVLSESDYIPQETSYINPSDIKEDISEYSIVSDNKPLKIKTMSKKNMNSLVQELKTNSRNGYSGMFLSMIEYKYSMGELRKVNVEDKTMYYCVYSDKGDENRVYIFFWKLNEWACYNYVVLKMDSEGHNVIKGEKMIKYIYSIDLK